MKKSEMLKTMDCALEKYHRQLLGNPDGYSSTEFILDEMIKAGMTPPRYIHPKAYEDGLTDPKWGYIEFIDKYPEHHFRNGRPYEYYVDGWEPENEEE